MAEMSRISTPPKFIQAEKSWLKQPKFCYLHSYMYHAEIIWTGLLPHSSAKKRFSLREFMKIGTRIKYYGNASKQDTIGYQENALRI